MTKIRRSEMAPTEQRVYRAAMRWHRAWKGGWDRPSFIFPTKLENACAADAAAKKRRKK